MTAMKMVHKFEKYIFIHSLYPKMSVTMKSKLTSLSTESNITIFSSLFHSSIPVLHLPHPFQDTSSNLHLDACASITNKPRKRQLSAKITTYLLLPCNGYGCKLVILERMSSLLYFLKQTWNTLLCCCFVLEYFW